MEAVSLGRIVLSYDFLTTILAQSSKTRIVEQKSSSPQPLAMVACSIWWVTAVIGRGKSNDSASSMASPTYLCIHLVEKLVTKSRLRMKGALYDARPLLAELCSKISI